MNMFARILRGLAFGVVMLMGTGALLFLLSFSSACWNHYFDHGWVANETAQNIQILGMATGPIVMIVILGAIADAYLMGK